MDRVKTSNPKQFGALAVRQTNDSSISNLSGISRLTKEESGIFLEYIINTLGDDNSDSSEILEGLISKDDVLSMLSDEDQATLGNVLDNILVEFDKYQENSTENVNDNARI